VTTSDNNLNDKAVELPSPVYPPAAKAVRASGEVVVEITVNQKGEVTSANAISGHALLRAAAVQGARKAKFKPNAATKGVLTYNFVAPN
jgi:TonB family protein